MGALKLLLDTHVFYWWHTGDTALSLKARSAIADRQNEKYVSAITAWEFIIKFRSNKEPAFANIAEDVVGAVAAQGFTELAITMRHAQTAARLPFHHKDPMDRILIAQATTEGMTIVTTDSIFGNYTTNLLW